jgi:putative flippase GtrA
MPLGPLRFIKYSIVGTSTFLFDVLLLYLLVEVLMVQQVLASAVAFIIAVSINYTFSRRYVFKSTLRSVKVGYLNFAIIAIAGLLIVTGGMYVLTTIWSVHFLTARVLVAGVTGFWSYLMNLYVNFKVVGEQ